MVKLLSRRDCRAIRAKGNVRIARKAMELRENFTMAHSLAGKTLNVLAMRNENFLVVKTNETGSIVQASGILSLIIDWISRKYFFSYVIFKEITPRMEDLHGERGILSYVLSGEADVVLGSIFPAIQIYNRMDFTTSWLDSPLSILIPLPEASANLGALIQPFSYQVWIFLIVTIIVASVALYAVGLLSAHILKATGERPSRKKKKNIGGFDEFQAVYEYISTVFLSQGGWCQANMLSIRLIAAAWCLGCFVLVQSYSSTLISYVLSPRVSPIINSVDDIPKVNGLQITVDRGRSIETSILKADNGVLKQLGDTLRENPYLRCNKTEECLARVRSGRYVYINGAPVVQGIVNNDRKTTGMCHFSIAKESFWPSPIVLGIPKGSQHAKIFNKGLIQLRENGLLYFWAHQLLPKPDECINKYKEKPVNPRLQIVNLTGAFVVLVSGYIFSLVSFLIEMSIASCQRKQCKHESN